MLFISHYLSENGGSNKKLPFFFVFVIAFFAYPIEIQGVMKNGERRKSSNRH
jgi:hypothetical protein